MIMRSNVYTRPVQNGRITRRRPLPFWITEALAGIGFLLSVIAIVLLAVLFSA
jgi:hypothetical protein